MSVLAGRALPSSLLACFWLLFGIACKRPETALRERPVQRVEVVQTVEGMTPEETHNLEVQLLADLGAPGGQANPSKGPVRVFRLTLKGNPNPGSSRGLGKTWAVSTGYGVLFGALGPGVVGAVWATWRSVAIAGGAGGLLGFGYGPVWYRNNQTLLAELGYLPWQFTDEWEVLDRELGSADEVVARSGSVPPFYNHETPALDLKPYLKPLPIEARGPAEIRQASLRAYGEALVAYVKKKR